MADDDLLKELKADLEHERWQRLWQGFGTIMVGVSLVVVLVTIGAVYAKHREEERAGELTAKFLQGLERLSLEDNKGASAIFAALAQGDGDIAALAALREAETQLRLKQEEKAAAAYAALADREATDPALRDLAAFRLRALQPENPVPQAPVPGQAFYFSHAEQYALAALAKGERGEAIATLTSLRQHPEAPASLRERAALLLTHLSPAAGKETP